VADKWYVRFVDGSEAEYEGNLTFERDLGIVTFSVSGEETHSWFNLAMALTAEKVEGLLD
jgi:hypothetical protein